MSSLSLDVETVLDGALRLKATGTGFIQSTAKMLVVFDDVAATATGAPFASLVVDIDVIVDGAFTKLFTIPGLTNGELYVTKAMIGTAEAVVVDGPSARPTKPVLSILEKKENAVKINVDLIDKFGGDYENVLLFVKLVSGNATTSIQKIPLGPFQFVGKTREQMKIERVLDSTVFEREKLYEVAVIASSARTGYSLISDSLSVKMSDLLDPATNIVVEQHPIYADRVSVRFNPDADFFSNYVTKTYDPIIPSRLVSMALKSPVTFSVGIKVGTSVLEPSVAVTPSFLAGQMTGQTLVGGVLTGGSWQDAALVQLEAYFTIPDALRDAATLSVVATIVSICDRDADNLYDFNKGFSAAKTILGKIGVNAGLMPAADISLAKGSNEDIVATVKVFFNTDAEFHNYHGKNRLPGYSNLVTFMDLIDAVTGGVLEENIQLGSIGTGLANAASVVRTYSAAQYKVEGLGRKLGLRFRSAETATGIKTLPVVSAVSKFIEQPGEMQTFAVESAGTVAAPQILALWTPGKTFGSQLKDFQISYLKEIVKVTGATTGQWVEGGSYAAGDSATNLGVEYVAILAHSYTLSPAYVSTTVYSSGTVVSFGGRNHARKNDVGGNVLSGISPADITKWTILNPVSIFEVAFWKPRFEVSVYSNAYAPTVREQFFTNGPDGTQFPLATIVNLRIVARYIDRNSTDLLAVTLSNSLDEKASMGSHIVNALQFVLSYDTNANTGTITIKDKIVDVASIAGFSVSDDEHLSPTTELRVVTRLADNEGMTVNVETIAASAGALDSAIKTYALVAGVLKIVHAQQSFSLTRNGQTFIYNGPVTLINLTLRKNIELTNPTVTYSVQPVVPAAYVATTVYTTGTRVLFGTNSYTRTSSGSGSNVAPTGNVVASTLFWTDNGPFSSARVILTDKAAAVAALANSSFSDIRTVFGVTIVANGATLNGWSTIGIPHIATANAMAASYKSGNTLVSFNTGDSSYSTVTGKWEVTYSGVWSAAIEMASSTEGARMIANPSSAILSASI